MPSAITLERPKRTSPDTACNSSGRDAKGVRALTLPNDSTRRRSTGKRLRFEVFKRDYFTCRYCGAQPPDVVLVVDHVIPVALGGPSTLDNLITACEPCNQGKAARSLGEVPPRTDADLLYMEVQQEIAEMRRYKAALDERESETYVFVERLQQLWIDASGLNWYPVDRVIRKLLRLYPMEIVSEGLIDVGEKMGSGYIERGDDRKWVAYLHAVCRNMAAESGEVEGD
jgi:hypothetical protein